MFGRNDRSSAASSGSAKCDGTRAHEADTRPDRIVAMTIRTPFGRRLTILTIADVIRSAH